MSVATHTGTSLAHDIVGEYSPAVITALTAELHTLTGITAASATDTCRVWYVAKSIEDQHYGWGSVVFSSADVMAARSLFNQLVQQDTCVMNGYWLGDGTYVAPSLGLCRHYLNTTPVSSITEGLDAPEDVNIILFCIDYPVSTPAPAPAPSQHAPAYLDTETPYAVMLDVASQMTE